MLKLKNVSFGYTEKLVLKRISLAVTKGKHVSLIGESGCGKSTLLQLIYGLHHTNGKVSWKDTILKGPKYNLVPGEPFIKYLAQDFDLMPPLTVAENIGKHLSNAYPIKKKRRVNELLEVVEMQDLADEKAGNLSGGQQQRVAAARAMLGSPEIIIADEPTSALDNDHRQAFIKILFDECQKEEITLIFVSHDATLKHHFSHQLNLQQINQAHFQESM